VKEALGASSDREPPSPERRQRSRWRQSSQRIPRNVNRRDEYPQDRFSDHRYSRDRDPRNISRSGHVPFHRNGFREQRTRSNSSRRSRPATPSGGFGQNQNSSRPRKYDDFDVYEPPRGRSRSRDPFPDYHPEYVSQARPPLHKSYSQSSLRSPSRNPGARRRRRPSSASSFLDNGDSHYAQFRASMAGEPTHRNRSSTRTYFHNNAFIHRPLVDARTHFRLLRVRRVVNGMIQCEMCHAELPSYGPFESACPRYTALSYTWGAKKPTFPISISYCGDHRSQTFQVTQNLHELLSHVAAMGITPGQRGKKFTGWWWIDAICIVQENDAYQEKGIQLDHMRQIYSNANEVFAWIGPASQDKGYGMHHIANTKSLKAAANDGYDSDQLSDTGSRLDAMQEHIESIFSAEYWSRLWILQELAVSQNTTLACGKDELSWRCVINFATQVAATPNIDPRSHIITRQYVWLLSLIYRNKGGRLDLATLLYLSEQAECERQEDRIIALLGLLKDGKTKIPPARHPNFPCGTLYSAIGIMLQDLRESDMNIEKAGVVRRQCFALAREAHRTPPADEIERQCVNLAICREIARTIVGRDPIVLTTTLKRSGDKWCFHRNRMRRDKSRSRSRSRSGSRSGSRAGSSVGSNRSRSGRTGGRRRSRSRSRSRSRRR
jgi:hypothetical protein